MKQPLTHINKAGEVHMVAIADKQATARTAIAMARVRMQKETLDRLIHGTGPKGDVLATARVAGIQAAKRTSHLIPLCHPIALTGAEIAMSFVPPADDAEGAVVEIRATIHAFDRTGVEMEALVAASTAALTIYDMLKAIDRWMTITDVCLLEKSGGRSGHLRRTHP